MTRPLSLAVLALLSAGLPAWAEDFTVTVPVRISNAPAVQQFAILCSAYDSADRRVGGGSSLIIGVSGGAISQDVVVRFNANGDYPASSAVKVDCSWDVFVRDSSGRNVRTGYAVLPDVYRSATGQGLAEYTQTGTARIR